jgi:hypothetical protein
MAIIHISVDNKLDSVGDFSGMKWRYELASHCDGELCRKRPQLVLPDQQYLDWYEGYYRAKHGKPPDPVGPHWHLVGTRSHPGAEPHYYYVPFDPSDFLL